MLQEDPKSAIVENDNALEEKSFSEILKEFKTSMKYAFHDVDQIDQFCSTRGFPERVLKELMRTKPLALCIPKEYGGRGFGIKENLSLGSAASYESLALSLMLGINNGLFIQPLSKYGQESTKKNVFNQFMHKNSMGGLMITEPDFGSDALNMLTYHTEKSGMFHLKGKKHWAGLTGKADFWILTARKKAESGKLLRDIDLFVCDVAAPQQHIEVEEYFENLGLYQITYGRNLVDVQIPSSQKLVPHTNGIQMLLDLLHRSRFQFPGMGLGFIKRILDEAIQHAQTRSVSNKNLFHYDQIQNRLSRLQANYTICSAFCLQSVEIADLENDLSNHGLEANIIKTVTSDLMHESAQSLLQMVGAKGYRINHFAGRSLVDSRPFQIFEGSNDILYHQISNSVFKLMKSAKQRMLSDFLSKYCPRLSPLLKANLHFEIPTNASQRKLVEFGKLMSRIVSMDHVMYLAEKGFRKDLIENAIDILKQEIASLLSVYQSSNSSLLITDYETDSNWFSFVG